MPFAAISLDSVPNYAIDEEIRILHACLTPVKQVCQRGLFSSETCTLVDLSTFQRNPEDLFRVSYFDWKLALAMALCSE